jgi:hypothetical protein
LLTLSGREDEQRAVIDVYNFHPKLNKEHSIRPPEKRKTWDRVRGSNVNRIWRAARIKERTESFAPFNPVPGASSRPRRTTKLAQDATLPFWLEFSRDRRVERADGHRFSARLHHHGCRRVNSRGFGDGDRGRDRKREEVLFSELPRSAARPQVHGNKLSSPGFAEDNIVEAWPRTRRVRSDVFRSRKWFGATGVVNRCGDLQLSGIRDRSCDRSGCRSGDRSLRYRARTCALTTL